MSRWKPTRHRFNPKELPRMGLGMISFPLYGLVIRDPEGDINLWKLRDSYGPGLILASSVEGIEAAAEVVAEFFPKDIGKPVEAVGIEDLADLLRIRNRIEAKIHTKGFYFNLHNPRARFDFGWWDEPHPRNP